MWPAHDVSSLQDDSLTGLSKVVLLPSAVTLVNLYSWKGKKATLFLGTNQLVSALTVMTEVMERAGWQDSSSIQSRNTMHGKFAHLNRFHFALPCLFILCFSHTWLEQIGIEERSNIAISLCFVYFAMCMHMPPFPHSFFSQTSLRFHADNLF